MKKEGDLTIMVTSINKKKNNNKRKALSNLTGSTNINSNNPLPNHDDWVGDGKRIVGSRKQTMLKTRSKTKAADVPVYPICVEKTTNDTKNSEYNMESLPMPLSIVKIHDSRKRVLVPLSRDEFEGSEDELQSKLSKDPIPNNKKRTCSPKGSSKEFVMPHDFIRQQRAYFKEIDEFELEVEEVEELLDNEE